MRSSVVVLLGAGASVDAGLPTSAGLTAAMLEHFATTPRINHLEPALRYVHHLAEADRAARGVEGGVDIERLFTVVDLLANLESNPLTPFVERWHGGLELLRTPGSLAPPKNAERIIRDIRSSSDRRTDKEAGQNLLEFIQRLTEAPAAKRNLFADVRIAMLNSMRSLVGPTVTEEVSYLAPLLQMQATGRDTTIATLNYDLTVETSAQQLGVPLGTGIADWIEEGTLRWLHTAGYDAVQLLKLHGSIDWWRDTLNRAEPWGIGKPGRDSGIEPGIVFGEGNKLRADGPFLPLLAEFETRLRGADDLIIVGYSFRDDHVNEVLRRWLRFRRETRRVIIVSPSFSERFVGSVKHEPGIVQELRRVQPNGTPHARFHVVKEYAAAGISRAVEMLPPTLGQFIDAFPEE